MDRWEGKLAVVTGAGAGIGAAVAEALAKYGVDVLALDTKIVRLFSLKERAKHYLGKIYPQQVDVTKEEEVKAAFKWAKEKYGGIDILVNNAGVTHLAKITEGDTDGFRRVLETNVVAVALFVKEAVKSMQDKGSDGHIINMNSIFGHHEIHNLGRGLYPPSKFAVTVITETVRKELALVQSKIKITSISPGPVDTEISETAAAASEVPYTKKDIPRLLPSDIAEAVTYVLSTPPNVQIAEYTIRPFGETW